jgi:hypothetical protein
MGKKTELARAAAAEVEAERLVENALRAIILRREGHSWGDIADRLTISIVEAQELARVAYARLGEAEADQLRVEVEDRLDALVKKAHVDLALASSQGERTALYRFLAGVEAQRARLLGLNLKGGDDA